VQQQQSAAVCWRHLARLADNLCAPACAARLARAQAQGRLQRKLAHRVVLPELPPQQQQQQHADVGGRCSSGSGSGGRFSRAHRLSPTALALSSDGRTAFSVGKDGVILRWDLETMKRTQLVR
jgi:hypothetical protein